MPTYKIRGIDVEFPFEAYDCQIVYMEKVIQSLQQRSNALLESPTGTGKTLCLLCATLAWRKSLGPFSNGRTASRSQDTGGNQSEGSSLQTESSGLPTIVYTSRTHSQIRQVVKELKRTVYRPKMVVLGSREQLCIHPDVSLLKGKTQTNACHFLCQKRTKRYCTHFPRVSEFVKNNPSLGDEPIDIEDLVNIGKSSGPCPYYMSREIHKVVDILFAPYNYLIDPGNRKSLTIEWSNSILIFDEAHNLEGICADAASFDLPSALLTSCISEAEKCVDLAVARRDKLNDKSYNPDNFAILRALLLKLEKRIAEVRIDSKELGFTKPGPYIYELLGELNITHGTTKMLLDTIAEANELLEDDAKTNDSQKTKAALCRLESIGDILKMIFKENGDTHAQYYRVHVQEVEMKSSDTFKVKKSRTLSWWCFNPGVAMEEFSKKNVGSIILTSGTLSPMDSFAEELKLKFPVRLENPHVISDNQLWAGIVPVGPSGHPFNSSYRTRDSAEYKLSLGNSIVNFARIVPDGLLVFFPSYYLLNLCIDYWKNESATATNSITIWERICKHKQPVVEPRQSSLFSEAIDDYMAKLRDTSTTGAVFFAVCRGKVSEGLDFADNAGRAVIVTGIPFALWNDPKVRLKREFLDQHAPAQSTECKVLTGDEWYNQQASRAVNQAVGRVIRHRYDHGAIIFCDQRFTRTSHHSQISRWIQPHIKCYSKFGDVVFTLTRFFREAAISYPTEQKLTRIKESGPVYNVVDPGDKVKAFDALPHCQTGKVSDPVCGPTSPMVITCFAGSLDSSLMNLRFISDESAYPHGDMRKTKPTTLLHPESDGLCISFYFSGERSILDKIIPLDKHEPGKFLKSLDVVADAFCSPESSSFSEVKRGSLFKQLHEILPANRANLSFDKHKQSSTSKSITNQLSEEKLYPRTTQAVKKDEVVDLTSGEISNQLTAPRFLKKRKLEKAKYDNVLQQCNSSCDGPVESMLRGQKSSSSTHVSHGFFASRNTESVLECSSLPVKSEIKAQRTTTQFSSSETRSGISSSPCDNDQKKGSTFLLQVQEKLSKEEYKVFVDFMKALKSKAMKIGHVLQSIIKLFSSPDRLPLQQRFKDYIPAKYHSLYDHYLENQ